MERARQLYTKVIEPRAVAEVTAELREHLDTLIPACRRLLDQTPIAGESAERKRLAAALTNAKARLVRGCDADDPVQALTYMGLLAEDAAYLYRRIQAKQSKPPTAPGRALSAVCRLARNPDYALGHRHCHGNVEVRVPAPDGPAVMSLRCGCACHVDEDGDGRPVRLWGGEPRAG